MQGLRRKCPDSALYQVEPVVRVFRVVVVVVIDGEEAVEGGEVVDVGVAVEVVPVPASFAASATRASPAPMSFW